MQDNLPFSTEVIKCFIFRCQLMLYSSEEKNSTETDGETGDVETTAASRGNGGIA